MKLAYHPEETSKIIKNASKALSLENIYNFRRIRINSPTEATYSLLFDIKEVTEDIIILDFGVIKYKSNKQDPDNDFEFSSNNDTGILLFQRKFPKHDDFFLIDIQKQYFHNITNKKRSSLINRLIRCIDLSYILDLKEISVISNKPFSESNTAVNIKQISDMFDLSETEVAHLQLLSIIGTSKEIGSVFDLSPRTIEKMTSNLCKKLDFKNKLDLQLFAKFLTSYIDIPYEYISDTSKEIYSKDRYVITP